MNMKSWIFVCLALVCLPGSGTAIEVRKTGDALSEIHSGADSLLKEADAAFKARENQTALEKYGETLTAAREEFNFSVEVEALSQLARVNLVLGNKDEGRLHLDEAAAKATESDPYGWSRYLGVKGRFEWQDNDLPAARATFEQMYNYCTVNSLWGRAVDAAHMIAIVAETPQEQVEWGHRGIEAAEANDQESWLGPLWNNLACTYYDAKQFDSALTCKWLRPVLAWAERLENHSAIGQACEDLGEIEIAQGRQAQGLKLLHRARDEYKKEGYDTSWPEVWQHINQRLGELDK
jgi:tetratricopeptide (TPR) repeat protein